jgi:hypothetical protein
MMYTEEDQKTILDNCRNSICEIYKMADRYCCNILSDNVLIINKRQSAYNDYTDSEYPLLKQGIFYEPYSFIKSILKTEGPIDFFSFQLYYSLPDSTIISLFYYPHSLLDTIPSTETIGYHISLSPNRLTDAKFDVNSHLANEESVYYILCKWNPLCFSTTSEMLKYSNYVPGIIHTSLRGYEALTDYLSSFIRDKADIIHYASLIIHTIKNSR